MVCEARLTPSSRSRALLLLAPLCLLVLGLLALLAAPANAAEVPPPVLTAEPPPAGTDLRPTWAFTVSDGDTATCSLTGPAGYEETRPCAGSFTPSVDLPTDGDYAFSVTAVRAEVVDTSTATPTVTIEAGQSAPTTDTYLLDRVDPAVTVTPPDAADYDASSGWVVDVLDGGSAVTLSCTLTAPDGSSTGGSTCNEGVLRPGLPQDGLWTLSVTAVDAAGNTASGTATYQHDGTAPVIDLSGPTGTASNPTPTWTYTVDGGGAPTCTLTGPSSSASVACGPTSYTAALEQDGPYTLTVRADDAAGNSTTVTSDPYVLDTAAPQISLQADGPLRDRVDTRTWTVTAPGAVDLVCAVDGRSVDCAAPVVVTRTTDGAATLTVTATDAYGNTSTASATYVRDTVADLALRATPVSPGNDPTPSWDYAVAPTSTVTCSLTGGGATGTGSCGPSRFTADPLPATSGQRWVLTVTVTDDLGNRTEHVLPGYDLDTVADLALVAAPASPGTDRTPQWAFTVEPGATVACTLTGTGAAGGDCTTSGFTAAELPDSAGTAYGLSVLVTDLLGNQTTHTLPGYVLDSVAVLGAVVPPSSPGRDRTPEWAWTLEPGATVTCALSGPGAAGGACTTTGFTAAELPSTSGADYVLTVTVTDRLGSSTTYVQPAYRLDTVADLTQGSPPASPGNDRTPQWAFTVEPGATVTCSLTGPGAAGGACSTTGFTAAELPTTSGADYALTVTVTDRLGNATTYALADYRLDTVADLTAGARPASPGNDRTPQWVFTVEPGSTVACALTGPGAAGGTCTTTGFTAAELPTTSGADYALTVTVTDRVGNATTYALADYRLDTVADLAVTAPVSPGSDTTPTWQLTTEAGATVSCVLTGPGATGGSCTSTGFTAAELPPTSGADYLLTLTVTDALGNVTTYVQPVHRLDTQRPGAVVTVPAGPSRQVTVDWTVVLDEVVASATCELRRDGVVVSTLASCPGSTTVSLPGDGRYDVVVTLVDLAGNTSTTTSGVLVHDATAPAAPVVSPASTTTNRTTATWTITAEQGIATTCRLTRGGVLLSDWSTCGASHAVPLPGDGSYVLEVRSTDSVGSGPVTSVTYVLDTVAPSAPAVAGGTGPAQSRTPSWTVVAESGTTTQCRVLRAGSVVADWAPCGGTFTANLGGLPDGAYVLEARATDAAQNLGATGASAPYVLDTTAPGALLVTGPSGPSTSPSPSFTWRGEPGSGAQCQLYRDGVAVGGWTSCAPGYAPLLDRDGTWTLAVRLTDEAGNVGDTAVSGGYVLDTTPPAAPVVTPPGTPGRDLLPSWGAGVEGGTTLECRLTGPDGVSTDWASCTLPHTTPLDGRPDGAYVLEVRATDAAGNRSAVGRGTYLLDTVAPAAAVVAAPAGPGRSRTPVFTFTVEPQATTRCRLTSGTTVVQDVACTSPHAVDLAGLPDGAYTLTVRVTDAAGNPGPAATASYVLDTTAPAAPVLTSSPASPSPARTVTWAFGYEAGSTLVCRLTFPSGAVREIPSCASPLTLDLSGLPDGTYALTVRAVDAAGNVSAPLTDNHVLDAGAAAAPELVAPVTPGNGRTPSWRITSAAPTECRLSRGTTVLSDWSPCAGSFTADLFGQPDGAYALSVRARSASGALSAVATSRYVLDTTAPGGATVVAPPTPSTTTTPTWSVASAESGVTAQCRLLLFDSVLTDWAPCAVSAAGALREVDLTGRGDGTYTLVVRLTDAAGNRSSVEVSSPYVLDRSAPSAVGLTGPVSPGNTRRPQWTISAGGGASLECQLTGPGGVLFTWSTCAAGTYTADLTGRADGTYTLHVRAVSEAGTPGPDSNRAYVLSTVAPDRPTGLALLGTTSPGNSRTPAWVFTLPQQAVSASCTVLLGGRAFLPAAPCRSGFRLDLSSAADGTYTLLVEAVDAAGNRSEPARSTYVLDTEPTDPPELTQAPGSGGSTLELLWRFTVVYGATADCRLSYDGAAPGEWLPCDSDRHHAVSLVGRPDGRYLLEVRARDAAGNTSAPRASAYLLDRTAAPLASFTASPVTPAPTRTVSWTLSAPDGTTLECRLDAPDVDTAWGSCSTGGTAALRAAGLAGTTYVLDLTGRPEGSYVLEARVVEADGRRGAVSTSGYLLDVTRPAAPVIGSPPARVGDDPQPVWSWDAGGDALVECRLVRTGSAPGEWQPCPGGTYEAQLAGLADGTYVLELRVVDAAGNTSPSGSAPYRYDTTAPAPPSFTRAPAPGGSDRTVAWTFAVPVDTRATCTVTRAGTLVRESACAGRYDLDLTGLPDGVYTLTVRLTDTAGNASGPATGTYALRTGGPVRVDQPTPTGPRDPVFPGSAPTGPGRGGTGVVPPRAPDDPSRPGLPNAPDGGVTVRGADGPTPDASGSSSSNGRPPPDEPDPRADRGGPGALNAGVQEVLRDVITGTVTRPTLPLALLAIVVLFLLAQNRIDRRDPKLVGAPVEAEPELDFTLLVRRPGGAV